MIVIGSCACGLPGCRFCGIQTYPWNGPYRPATHPIVCPHCGKDAGHVTRMEPYIGSGVVGIWQGNHT